MNDIFKQEIRELVRRERKKAISREVKLSNKRLRLILTASAAFLGVFFLEALYIEHLVLEAQDEALRALFGVKSFDTKEVDNSRRIRRAVMPTKDRI